MGREAQLEIHVNWARPGSSILPQKVWHSTWWARYHFWALYISAHYLFLLVGPVLFRLRGGYLERERERGGDTRGDIVTDEPHPTAKEWNFLDFSSDL